MVKSEKQASACFTLVSPIPEVQLASCTDMRLRADIEKGDLDTKRRALEAVIHMYLSEPSRLGSSMLMTVIRFLLPTRDHAIKRLLLLFWEIVPKVDAEGKLRPEMILVCDSFRRDLQHPNEFIRGSTLRLLCKIQYCEILEPLVPCIFACLEHSHTYVRKNAILCVLAIYRNQPFLVPEASRIISDLLETEHDTVTKKNAFIALREIDETKALDFVESSGESLIKYSTEMQLRIVETIYHACLKNPDERWRFLSLVYFLTISESAAVRLEAAWTFTTFSTSQNASDTAAKVYIDIVVSEADNNVKLIVLSKLKKLCDERPRALTHMVLDLLRVLTNANDSKVQRQTLELSLQLVTSRSVKDYVEILKKQLRSTQTSVECREMIVETLHRCVKNIPETASSIVTCLVELVWSDEPSLALTVLRFLRETLTHHPAVRRTTLEELISSFRLLEDAKVLRQACWLMGEFCTETSQIEDFVDAIKSSIGELPIKISDSYELANGDCPSNGVSETGNSKTTTRVTADGTYASQSVFSELQDTPTKKSNFPLRKLFIDGEFFLATSVCGALAKVSTRMPKDAQGYRICAQSMMVVTSCLRLADSVKGLADGKAAANADDRRRLHQCMTMLLKCSALDTDTTRDALHRMLSTEGVRNNKSVSFEWPENRVLKEEQVDESISFRMLNPRGKENHSKNLIDESLEIAVKGNLGAPKGLFENTLLSKVWQLTGRSDPVYAEAYLTVDAHSLELDVLVVNQTDDTLQNCTLELCVLGKRNKDIAERPAAVILAPKDFTTLRALITVNGTETGLIFGTIVYDIKGSTADRHIVVLNDIKVNILDFLVPERCSDGEFRRLWLELEWERLVPVSTPIKDLRAFITHIAESARMAIVTDEAVLENDCGFAAANFCTKSLFGEEALANVCLTRNDDGNLEGQIRLRARNKGCAYRLGERLCEAQKTIPKALPQAH
ncbi:coatomer subunit beta [Galendromus occidentalis]|uniref:Coatomer subunit beta n=1 Tax=Galendromus occidentalis TaxID=34638 RepID=A0AAJ7SDD2_9ACAR|nr:coatomer subunit beta [Galendromus occidentalis]